MVNGSSPEGVEPVTTGGAQGGKPVIKANAPLRSPPTQNEDFSHGNEDVASLMQELDEMSRQPRTPTKFSAEGEDLNSFYTKLETMLTRPPKRTNATPVVEKHQPVPPLRFGRTSQRTEGNRRRDLATSPNPLGYVTALQLEKTGIQWEVAYGWSAYLFSSGPRGHDAVLEQYELVQAANSELDALIEQVLDEEASYWANEEKKLLPRRLILSNIAADADAEEVAFFLSKFKYDIQSIKMLVRDPISRTQTAHVDMYTQHAAKQASYTMGYIFGLVVKICLAADDE